MDLKAIASMPLIYKVFCAIAVLFVIGLVLSSTATGILVMLCSFIVLILIGLVMIFTGTET